MRGLFTDTNHSGMIPLLLFTTGQKVVVKFLIEKLVNRGKWNQCERNLATTTVNNTRIHGEIKNRTKSTP